MSIKIIKDRLVSALILGLFYPTFAYGASQVEVVTSVPSLKSLAETLFKENGKVISLSKGHQNPHFVDPKPSFILSLASADYLLSIGNELEVGWLPTLVLGAKNPKIAPGGQGHWEVAQFVDLLDVATKKVDRSEGDVHPQGNPHFMLDPRNGMKVMEALHRQFSSRHPELAPTMTENWKIWQQDWQESMSKWESSLSNLKGEKIVTYHKSWSYFLRWVGAEEFATIEPKPGVTPSVSNLNELILRMKEAKVKYILIEPYYSRQSAAFVAEKTGAKLLVLPSEVGAMESVLTYKDLFTHIVKSFQDGSK